MNTIIVAEFCKKIKPCKEWQAFVLLHPTMADAWGNCPSADWMLWVLEILKIQIEPKAFRLFAVWCARNTPLPDGRKTGDLLKDPRSLAALEIAERYALGRATIQELNEGIDAARAAASAALGAAVWDATWAGELLAARAAAGAAAAAGAWAAAEVAAEVALGTAARAAQADQLRKMIPNPFAQKGTK